MASRFGHGFIQLDLDADKMVAGLSRVQGKLKQFEGRLRSMSGMARNMLLAGGAALAGLVKLADTQEQSERRLAAVLRSTGEAAGFNAEQLKNMAAEMQKTTTFGDEATISAQAVLLTFRNIHREGNIFEDTLKAAQDMSTILGTDLQSSVLQIGKAMNDPAKGLSMLSRAGVTFNEEQSKLIIGMQKSGNLMAAQGEILRELQKQFGGAAEAAAEGSGAFAQAKNELGDLGEEVGATFMPSLLAMAKSVRAMLPAIKSWVTRNAELIVGYVKTAAKLLAVAYILPKLIALIRGMIYVGQGGIIAIKGMASAAKFMGLMFAGPVGIALAAATALVVIFLARMKAAQDALDAMNRGAREQTDVLGSLRKAKEDLAQARLDGDLNAEEDALKRVIRLNNQYRESLAAEEKEVGSGGQFNYTAGMESATAAVQRAEVQLASVRARIQAKAEDTMKRQRVAGLSAIAAEEAKAAAKKLEDEQKAAEKLIQAEWDKQQRMNDIIDNAARERRQKGQQQQDALTSAEKSLNEEYLRLTEGRYAVEREQLRDWLWEQRKMFAGNNALTLKAEEAFRLKMAELAKAEAEEGKSKKKTLERKVTVAFAGLDSFWRDMQTRNTDPQKELAKKTEDNTKATKDATKAIKSLPARFGGVGGPRFVPAR